MPEYKFNMGRLGRYRHFIVTADSEEQARFRFDMASKENGGMPTNGFKSSDIHSVELLPDPLTKVK